MLPGSRLQEQHINFVTKASDVTWTEISLTSPNATLNTLEDGATYEVQVATVCSGTTELILHLQTLQH
jgi:hypothetical protein